MPQSAPLTLPAVSKDMHLVVGVGKDQLKAINSCKKNKLTCKPRRLTKIESFSFLMKDSILQC